MMIVIQNVRIQFTTNFMSGLYTEILVKATLGTQGAREALFMEFQGEGVQE